jgi:hypothetical protein
MDPLGRGVIAFRAVAAGGRRFNDIPTYARLFPALGAKRVLTCARLFPALGAKRVLTYARLFLTLGAKRVLTYARFFFAFGARLFAGFAYGAGAFAFRLIALVTPSSTYRFKEPLEEIRVGFLVVYSPIQKPYNNVLF